LGKKKKKKPTEKGRYQFQLAEVVLGTYLLTYVLSSVGKCASHSQRKEEREAPSVWSGVKLVGGGGEEGRGGEGGRKANGGHLQRAKEYYFLPLSK
jgi:hypothetical protein